MNCKLLIVSKGKSFLIDSILQELDIIGLSSVCVGYDVKAVEAEKSSADIVLLFVDEYTSDMMQTLVYIKDVCADDSKTLYIAGYDAEIEKIAEIIPRELVKREFIRPIDAKKIVSEIKLETREVNKRRSLKEILLVDDDITYLKMVRKWLMDKYNVIAVKSGMQAIKYITSHKPDLILMDYEMPITTGSMVLEMIRSEPESADIPIIFLTGKQDKETVMQVMSLKPQGYLLKTMEKDKIVAAIDKYFENSKWQNAINVSEIKENATGE